MRKKKEKEEVVFPPPSPFGCSGVDKKGGGGGGKGEKGEKRKLPFLRILGAVRAETVEVGMTMAVI